MQKPHSPTSCLTQAAGNSSDLICLHQPPQTENQTGGATHCPTSASEQDLVPAQIPAQWGDIQWGVMFGTSRFNFSVISFVHVQGSCTDLRHPTQCWGSCSMERSEGTFLFWERGLHLAEPAPGASRSNYSKGPALGMQKTLLTSNKHHETLDRGLVRISVKYTKYSKLTSQLLGGKWCTRSSAEKEQLTVTLVVPTQRGKKTNTGWECGNSAKTPKTRDPGYQAPSYKRHCPISAEHLA